MRKRRFREEQIIGILQEVAAGATIREVSRRHYPLEPRDHRS
ncbi:MAG: transposase [Gemmatimonadetes bacterium]|nr:transposase [Gemmatimonadota bacterium]